MLRVYFAAIAAFRATPILKIAFAHFDRKKQRVSDLQNQCIKKAQTNAIDEAVAEIIGIWWRNCLYLASLQSREMPIWEKELYAQESYEGDCIAARRKKEILSYSLQAIEYYYKNYMKIESLLEEDLAEPSRFFWE